MCIAGHKFLPEARYVYTVLVQIQAAIVYSYGLMPVGEFIVHVYVTCTLVSFRIPPGSNE